MCHGNCASACNVLGLYGEALDHADASQRLAGSTLHRGASRSTYAKSFRRRGEALMGLGRWREAADAFAKGMDVGTSSVVHEEVNRNTVQELKELWKEAERRLETNARADDSLLLTWRTTATDANGFSQSITYHPHAAPIHRIKADDQLPCTLLTPFQAENDQHIKETYNYMTVQADIRMPKRALSSLGSEVGKETIRAYRKAIESAIATLEADDTDARVLNLSCGPGVSAVHAIRAGARHVTAAERWLYLSLAAKETMLENDVDDARYDVVYKRPTDMRLREDVPVSCNVLVIGADGVELESGVLLAAKHCFEEGLVMSRGGVVLPGSLRIMVRCVHWESGDANERTGVVNASERAQSASTSEREGERLGACDGAEGSSAKPGEAIPTLDGNATNRRQHSTPVTEAKEAWYFDLKSVYDRSEAKEVALPLLPEVVKTTANAVEFWYELDLLGETLRLPSRFERLAGELMLVSGSDGGEIVVTASHNTVGLRFDVSSSNYIRLFDDPGCAGSLDFERIANEMPMEVYERALTAGECGVRVGDTSGEGGVGGGDLDEGAQAIADGNLIRSILIPQASNMQPVIRLLEAMNAQLLTSASNQPDRTSIEDFNPNRHMVNIITTDLRKGTDPVQLQRGRNGVPIEGVDAVALYDRKGRYGMVEEWRTALGFSKVIPSTVTWWCAGAEAVTRPVEGVKLACLDRYRESGWLLGDINHHYRLLTERANVKGTLMKLKVNVSGYMNSVVYWHDLDGVDGFAHNARIVYMDRAVRVEGDSKVSVIGGGTETARTFKLRGNVGTPRALPPWEVTWGGGASVENPHYQRVHYCELILREFLGVVERGRTDIWKDVEMVLRHCGSLFLDRRTVAEVGRRLRSMERGLLLAGRGVKFSRWVDVFDEDVWFV